MIPNLNQAARSRGPLDERLPAEQPVLGVCRGGRTRAYPLAVVAARGLIEDKLGAQFVFTNPNEKARCGCGESFSV